MGFLEFGGIKLPSILVLGILIIGQQVLANTQQGSTDEGLMIEKCDRNNQKMIFRGNKVSLSKVLNDEGRLWCKHARTLEIFALESLTVDSNLAAHEDKDLSVIMITRELILNGNKTFNLSGTKGKGMVRAADGHPGSPNGQHGSPGNPGGNGGNFYGRYERLTKVSPSLHIVINVNGGEGGDGQDGGNGLNGETGHDAKREDFPSPYSELDSKMERLRNLELNVIYAYRYKNYLMHGKKGTPGSNGGDGGIGGLGGNPGIVDFSKEDGDSSTIKIFREQGKRGRNGKGGAPGHGGKNGDGYQCTWRGVLADSIRWWDKCHFVSSSKDASGAFAPSGNPGKSGGNSVGLRQPSRVEPRIHEFITAQEIFERFVVTNSR